MEEERGGEERTETFVDGQRIDPQGRGIPDDETGSWAGVTRGPRPPAEGVRIIGAEEAAAAIDAGQVASRVPEGLPRFGDTPAQPEGPRPSLRFPGADPAEVSKPPLAASSSPRAAREPRTARPEPAPASVATDAGSDDAGPHTRGFEMSFKEFLKPSRSARGGDPDPDPVDEPVGDGGEGRSAPAWAAPAWAPTDTGEVASLPHWTEPPTGEHPRLVLESESQSPGSGSWSSLTSGPRWRDSASDWDDSELPDILMGARSATRVSREPSAPPDPVYGAVPEPVASRGDTFEPSGGGDGSYAFASEERMERRAARASRPSPSAVDEPLVGGEHDDLGPARPRRRSAAASSGGRGGDLSARVLTGVVAGGVVIAAAALGPRMLAVLVGLVLVAASSELFAGLRSRGYQPATLLGVVATAALVAGVYTKGAAAVPMVVFLAVVFTLLWHLLGVVEARPTMNVAVTLLGITYVGVLGSFAAAVLRGPGGVGFLMGAVAVTVAHDLGSFFVGRSAGKTPLAGAISPNKTVEGVLGGTVAAIVAGAVVGQFGPWTLPSAVVLGVAVAVVAPLGDLCESMLKRDLGVKDMGNLLPGHGGVLDRVDGLLFVIPATYYLTRLLDLA